MQELKNESENEGLARYTEEQQRQEEYLLLTGEKKHLCAPCVCVCVCVCVISIRSVDRASLSSTFFFISAAAATSCRYWVLCVYYFSTTYNTILQKNTHPFTTYIELHFAYMYILFSKLSISIYTLYIKPSQSHFVPELLMFFACFMLSYASLTLTRQVCCPVITLCFVFCVLLVVLAARFMKSLVLFLITYVRLYVCSKTRVFDPVVQPGASCRVPFLSFPFLSFPFLSFPFLSFSSLSSL